MSKRRFQPPQRHEIAATVFEHPLYADLQAFAGWLKSERWPDLAELNAALPVAGRRFVVQDRTLLQDGLHYEVRIAERGQIATREQNWHDLFNALVWCRWPQVKQALNAQQCAHIASMGDKTRNRAQYALTQFDEAGVIVQVKSAALLAAWDRHDWTGLFFDAAAAWQRGDIRLVAVIGHALLEHGLLPGQYMVGKALVVAGEGDAHTVASHVAEAIAQGRVLADPLELRPLPLAGIPGWFAGQSLDFYQTAPCFQPLRAGRTYPSALTIHA
ncbi:hypothetical protein CO612_05355 [Lysobacteraceae bacterium NML71-0210]|nr:hypothetical protein CO612_05355 [Xanthomonadaceae bacterium NML71-0210]